MFRLLKSCAVAFMLLCAITAQAQQTDSPPKPAIQIAAQPVSTKLLSQYLGSTDHRAFVQQALKRTREGGHHYAMLALIDCIRWQMYQPIVQPSHELYALVYQNANPLAVQARQQLAAQCAEFQDDQALKLFISTGYERKQADPLMNAQLDVQDTLQDVADGTPAHELQGKLRSQLQHLLALQDPTLPTHELLSQVAIRATHNSTIWFEGVHYGNTIGGDQPNRMALVSAIELALCEGQAHCSIQRNMRQVCAMLSQCFDSPVDFARDVYVQTNQHGNALQFDAALKLIPKIKTHIAAGNIKAFLPPKVQASQHTSAPKTAPQDVAALLSAAKVQAAKIEADTSQMRSDYLAASDYRAFILNALRRPKEGGYFYAQQALNMCSDSPSDGVFYHPHVKKAKKAAMDQSTQSSPAQKQIEKLCKTLPQDQAKSWLALLETSYSHQKSRDPLYASISSYVRLVGGKFDQRAIADFENEYRLISAFKFPPVDPKNYINRLILQQRVIWFKGESYTQESTYPPLVKSPSARLVNRIEIEGILHLAQCNTTNGCPYQSSVPDECANNPACIQSPVNAFRDVYISKKRSTPEKLDAALKLLPAIRAEIDNGNLRALMPPAASVVQIDDIWLNPTPPSARGKSISTNMQAAYRASQDHYAFAVMALKKPEEGGYYYAERALESCARSADDSAVSVEDLDKQVQNLKLTLQNSHLYARKQKLLPCQSPKIKELQAKTSEFLYYSNPDNKPKDPILRTSYAIGATIYGLSQNISKPSKRTTDKVQEPFIPSAQLLEQLNEAIRMNEPGLSISSFTVQLAKVASGDQDTIWFDGKKYSYNGRPEFYLSNIIAFESVLGVAGCLEFGCSGLSGVSSSCAEYYCTDSQIEFMRKPLGDGFYYEPEQFDHLVKLIPKLRVAIRSGNLRAFLPPQKLPTQ